MSLSSIAAGATAGAALGPIGAAVGGILGAAPDLLNALGIHLFNEDAASAALNVIKAVTGKADPAAADLTGLSADQRMTLQLGMTKIAADREAANRAADLAAMQATYADIADARRRDAAMTAGGRSNTRANLMLAIAGVALVSCIFLIALVDLDKYTLAAIANLSGMVMGCLKDAYGFEFGSSVGSREWARSAQVALVNGGGAAPSGG